MKNENSEINKTGRPKTSIYRRLFGKSSRELSRELHISEATITRMRKEGKLEHLKLKNCSDEKIDPRIIKSFGNIWNRCNYSGTNKYEYYGGKGVKCLLSLEDLVYLWKRDKADSMEIPSVDRIDHNGHYTIENCRFMEFSENRKRRATDTVVLYKPTKKLLDTLKLFNVRKLCRKLGWPDNYMHVLNFKRVAVKKDKAEKLLELLNSIPPDIFKFNIEDAYDLTNYKEQRRKRK